MAPILTTLGLLGAIAGALATRLWITDFPDSVDTFTSPAANAPMDASRTHSERHHDLVDAVLAIETFLLGGGGRAPWRFDIVDYGAEVDNATDDTAAIQAAIDAAYDYADTNALGYAEVYSSRAGVALVAGALQTTGGYNAQIKLPDRDIDVPKVILGINQAGDREVSANAGAASEVGNQSVKQNTGWIIRSSLTGKSYDATHGLPCVIGGPDFEKTVVARGYRFSNLRVVGDLSVRLPDNPSVCAVNLGGIAQCELANINVDTDVIAGTDFGGGTHNISEPTHPTGVGIVMPQVNNNGHAKVRRAFFAGLYTAVVFSEHTDIDQLSAVGNLMVKGMTAPYNHLVTVRRANMEWNKFLLGGLDYTTGAESPAAGARQSPIDFTWDIEHLTSAVLPGDWKINAGEISDYNDAYTGIIRFLRVDASVGVVAGLDIVVGGSGIAVIDLAAPSAGGAAGVGWTDLTLVNSWTEVSSGGAGLYKPQYRKYADGLVELRGAVTGGTIPSSGSSGGRIAQLPVGFRPKGQKLFFTPTGATTGAAVEIVAYNDSGNPGAIFTDAAANTLVTLDGILFHAEG